MNSNHDPNDGAVLRAVHDAVSGLPMPSAPPLDTITAMGRARRRRRLAGASVVGAGACAALAVGLAASQAGPVPQNHAPTAQLAAFTVTSGSGGTTTLTLHRGMVANPSAVRQALADHGIPAIVTVGEVCHTAGYPGGRVSDVVTPLGGFPRPAPSFIRKNVLRSADGHLPKNVLRSADGHLPKNGLRKLPVPAPHRLGIVIHGLAIPSGSELSIGYFKALRNQHGIEFTLIKKGVPLTCASFPRSGDSK